MFAGKRKKLQVLCCIQCRCHCASFDPPPLVLLFRCLLSAAFVTVSFSVSPLCRRPCCMAPHVPSRCHRIVLYISSTYPPRENELLLQRVFYRLLASFGPAPVSSFFSLMLGHVSPGCSAFPLGVSHPMHIPALHRPIPVLPFGTHLGLLSFFLSTSSVLPAVVSTSWSAVVLHSLLLPAPLLTAAVFHSLLLPAPLLIVAVLHSLLLPASSLIAVVLHSLLLPAQLLIAVLHSLLLYSIQCCCLLNC